MHNALNEVCVHLSRASTYIHMYRLSVTVLVWPARPALSGTVYSKPDCCGMGQFTEMNEIINAKVARIINIYTDSKCFI